MIKNQIYKLKTQNVSRMVGDYPGHLTTKEDFIFEEYALYDYEYDEYM